MTRVTRTTIGAAAAALATAGVLAAGGSAQAPAGTTLHLVSTPQKGVGFFPKGKEGKQGDRIGFGSKIGGDDTGIGRGYCTFIGAKTILCTLQAQLSKGTLSLQGLTPHVSKNTPVSVIGGTGAYNGARGTALLTDTKTGTKVDVSLLP